MSAEFEELDWSRTPIGELTLRRRLDPVSGRYVFEVKLGDEFLMSSLFTVAEIALAQIALATPRSESSRTRACASSWSSSCFSP